MAYQINSSAYVPTFLFDTRRGFETIRVMKIGITHLTHVLWKCFMCPQNVNFPISIWLYATKITIFLHFYKIDMGIYGRE